MYDQLIDVMQQLAGILANGPHELQPAFVQLF